MADWSELQRALRQFAEEREWKQFHTPRNTVLALTGEVGELAALVQWIPDAQIESALREPELRTAFADELADCLAYLMQIADAADIDLLDSLEAKLGKNAEKYPVDLARGSSSKYDRLHRDGQR